MPQGYNLNKLGRGLLGDATYKVLGFLVSDKKIFNFHLEYLFLASLTYYAMDQNHLNNFGRGSPKDHLCEIISKLDLGFRRCHLSQLLTDGRTYGGRRPNTIAHLVTT